MPTTSPAVELILARLRESGDFPAMAKTVGTVSTLTSSEDTSISALADTVLQDYGLAQKLLRLVNTLAYARPRPLDCGPDVLGIHQSTLRSATRKR